MSLASFTTINDEEIFRNFSYPSPLFEIRDFVSLGAEAFLRGTGMEPVDL